MVISLHKGRLVFLTWLFLSTLSSIFLHASDQEDWLTGIVLATDPERFLIQVDPQAANHPTLKEPYWFTVSPSVIAHIHKGDRIRGQAVMSQGRWRLENLSPYNPQYDYALQQAGRLLRRDTLTRGKNVERQVGEDIPSFALINQDNELIQHTDLLRNYVVINFIFTRCPNPEMCPASTRRMIALQKNIQQIPLDNVKLYSITLDPAYDTPYVLREYGVTWGADFKRFQFLTGPESTIQDLLKQFSITTRDQDGTIDHTMSTVLIAPNGKILHKVEGTGWSVLDFVTRIQDHQSTQQPSAVAQ
jgi:protein SCO1/2